MGYWSRQYPSLSVNPSSIFTKKAPSTLTVTKKIKIYFAYMRKF